MALFDHEGLVRRYAEAMNTNNRQLMAAQVTADFITDWPQSGERVRGLENFWAIIDNYPGANGRPPANDVGSVHAHPTPELKLVAPSFTFVSVDGGGNSGTFTLKSRYPDGSHWWIVALYTLRDDRMAHTTTYFAPAFDAPDWRAQWVERM